MLVEEGSNSSADNRKDNRGSGRRIRHANKHKASTIEFYENESGGLDATQFCKKRNLPRNMIKCLSAGKHG